MFLFLVLVMPCRRGVHSAVEKQQGSLVELPAGAKATESVL